MNSPIRLIRSTLTLLLLILSSFASAIDVDRSQAIEIESDSAVIDDSQGLSTYRGNVIISQGSTELRADSITVFANDRRLSQIVATGSPASFKQQDPGTEQGTTGQAEQITYNAADALLIFDGNATLSQSTNAFSGEKIEYDIMRKAIRANGDENSGKRVKIQYFPSEPSAETDINEPSQSDDNKGIE